MSFHDANLHAAPADAYGHIRLAYVEGLAGKSFTASHRTPFRNQLSAQEEAYAAWMDGRDARADILKRRIAQNQGALDQLTVDRAAAKQPTAFPGHPFALSPAGAGPSTLPPVGGPERSGL